VWADLGRSSELRSARQAQHEQVEDEAVVLEDEGRELQTANQAVRVGVIHVLVVELKKKEKEEHKQRDGWRKA